MDRSPSQRSNSASAPGANRLTPNSPKLSLDSSPRIPYDTHAFAGQGDYSELRSPLMNEHKVPLELLQQAYLSTSMEQRYSQMSTSSASPHQSPAIGGSPFAAPPNVASFPSARQFSNSGSGFNTPTPFSNGFTFGAPPRQPIGDQDNRSVPDILVSPQTERIRQGELSGRRGSDDLGLAKPVEIEVQPQPQAGYEAAVESAASAAPQLSMSHQGYPRVSYTSANLFPPVTILPASKRKRILVTGGAGFVGSHLVDRLMFLGHEVTVLDNFFSGAKTAVSHWVGHPHFELVRHDVTIPFHIECDMIYHLACPASPRAYQYNQIKTMKTNFLGTMNMLGLAKRTKARFLLSSTSEVYGSPEVHPQPETYWGNVNPIGPRACYDEGKRVAEALTFGYLRQDGVDVRVARIFNSFGPRMTPGDGRVVSNFVLQALKGEDITIYGDGSQTRSLLFVHDLVDGLILLMNSDCTTPVNIGSPYEGTILHWAKLVIAVVDEVLIELTGGDPAVLAHRKSSQLVFGPMPQDDPPRRQADTTRAKEVLGWHPQWSVRDGLRETVKSFLQSETIDIDVQSALRGKIDL